MGPYTKTQTSTAIYDGWEITDRNGQVIAIVETETLANAVLAALLNPQDRPDYPAGEPQGEQPEDEGRTPFYCQNCDHHAEEAEFWPGDGNPAPHICPECGSTECFPVG